MLSEENKIIKKQNRVVKEAKKVLKLLEQYKRHGLLSKEKYEETKAMLEKDILNVDKRKEDYDNAKTKNSR